MLTNIHLLHLIIVDYYFLFIVDILFSNHFIKPFKLIKPIRVNDQNIKYFFKKYLHYLNIFFTLKKNINQFII
jgi:hypothetical protein